MKVIYVPELPEHQRYPRPTESAEEFRVGTIIEDDRGARWKVEWDNQDHRHAWERVAGYPEPQPTEQGSGDA